MLDSGIISVSAESFNSKYEHKVEEKDFNFTSVNFYYTIY